MSTNELNEIINITKRIESLEKLVEELFYKKSLKTAQNNIIERIETTNKAPKDIVGEEYEAHRKRIWEYFGFIVIKEKYEASFNVDLSILYNSRLIAFEESKGHYLDSCFHERAISGFCKTINAYLKKKQEVPLLIINSFVRYNKFDEKLNEDMETRSDIIKEKIKEKLKYTYLLELINGSRISKKDWMASKESTQTDSYSRYACDQLILDDIAFIKSLIPVHQ